MEMGAIQFKNMYWAPMYMMKYISGEKLLKLVCKAKKKYHMLLYQTVERDFSIILKFKLKRKAENNKYPYIWFLKKYKSLKDNIMSLMQIQN